ncbi:MAG: hypothetical protein MUF64_00155 [Polyangiaceae bacterium]|nr:hypothetical protein [Polyangiaceae bacterium]
MATLPPEPPFELEPQEQEIPRYPAPLDPLLLPARLKENPIVQLYLSMAPQFEGEFAEMAAADAQDDVHVAAALVASAR